VGEALLAGCAADLRGCDRPVERPLEFGRALLDVGLGATQVGQRLPIHSSGRARRSERRLIERHGRAGIAVARIGICAPEQFPNFAGVRG
jgi:hypothetical protein